LLSAIYSSDYVNEKTIPQTISILQNYTVWLWFSYLMFKRWKRCQTSGWNYLWELFKSFMGQVEETCLLNGLIHFNKKEIATLSICLCLRWSSQMYITSNYERPWGHSIFFSKLY